MKCDIFFCTSSLHALQRPFQPLGKSIIGNWLQHVVQCINLIALQGKLGHICHKNNNNIGIHLTDMLGCRHSIHKLQLNVHDQDVKIPMILFHQVCSILIADNLKSYLILLLIFIQILLQGFCIGIIILYNCNP